MHLQTICKLQESIIFVRIKKSRKIKKVAGAMSRQEKSLAKKSQCPVEKYRRVSMEHNC